MENKIRDCSVDCSKLIPYLKFENTDKIPTKLVCVQGSQCWCISNHNGYINSHATSDAFCEACNGTHPGKLCDYLDLVCDICDESIVDICLYRWEQKRIKTAWRNTLEEHICDQPNTTNTPD